MSTTELYIALGWLAVSLVLGAASWWRKWSARRTLLALRRSMAGDQVLAKRKTATAFVDWQPGALLLSEFVVEGILGRGGLGVVYRVRSGTLGQDYAVKKIHYHSQEHRQSILAELQTWLALPVHPHITGCRFYKTIGDDIVIFTELMKGGSVADWITNNRLTTIEQRLDVAIQSAWGLDALHRLGFVHQDVKPSNLLLTDDGTVKVSDFGIARGSAQVEQDEQESVTYGGMTPAYCSPEQHRRQRLDFRTDVWSWGLSLFAMFAGDPPVQRGVLAAVQLKRFLGTAGEDSELPPEVVAVLERCFQRDPGLRWADLRAAADALCLAYERIAGERYSRSPPETPTPMAPQANALSDRRTSSDSSEHVDPREFLPREFLHAHTDPGDAALKLMDESLPRASRARLAVYLRMNDQVEGMLTQALADGHGSVRANLAACLMAGGRLHEAGSDLDGACACYERAIVHYEHLHARMPATRQVSSPEAMKSAQKSAHQLAQAHERKASLLLEQGYALDAGEALEEAIELRQPWPQLGRELAATWVTRGKAQAAQGDRFGAVGCLQTALARYQDLEDEGIDTQRLVAQGFATLSSLIFDLGDHQAGLRILDEAVALFQDIVGATDDRRAHDDLARAYANRGAALTACGRLGQAAADYQRGIDIREALWASGADDLAMELASVYSGYAAVLARSGRADDALRPFQRAMQLLEEAIGSDGRVELRTQLAWTGLRYAQALRSLGRTSESSSAAQQAGKTLAAIVELTGHAEHHRLLAWGQRQFPELVQSP